MFTLPQLRAAHEVVRAALAPTPALAWPLLARRLETEVVVKHENHNPTGAFKVRRRTDVRRCAQAPEAAFQRSGLGDARQSWPEPRIRRRARRAAGDDLRSARQFGGEKRGDASARSRTRRARRGFPGGAGRGDPGCRDRGLDLVPAFHPDLVLGVATYALELFGDHRDLDVLYVPVGQGSGICGCIAARDALGLRTEIVGVQSAEAPAYALSLAAGHVVRTDSADTLADGMATRVPDEEALAVIRRGIARFVLVTDAEIADAIRAYWTDTHNLAEGAGAAPLAAAVQEKHRLSGKKVGLVLSGGNIDFDLFRSWVVGPMEDRR